LPERLLPTLFILIAPPAVGFISYVKLTGSIDAFAKILYYFALFLTILLFAQGKMFLRIKYYLSWWAYSFPIAAMTISSILMFHKTHICFFKFVAFLLATILTLIIAILVVKTIIAIKDKKICVEEE
jgi:tellurite resistance protein